MSLSNIKKSELNESGYTFGTYKGFNVSVFPHRYGYRMSISVFVDQSGNSDALISIYNESEAFSTLEELKAVAREVINEFPFKAKDLITLYEKTDFTCYNADEAVYEVSQQVLFALSVELSEETEIPIPYLLDLLETFHDAVTGCGDALELLDTPAMLNSAYAKEFTINEPQALKIINQFIKDHGHSFESLPPVAA